MGGSGVIDNFLGVFTSYIDSGFGLLSGEVAFIATTLIVIDVTLAALFWSWGADDDIIARLVKKTLFVGVFAYIIGNFNWLASIVFRSFAGLGLTAEATISLPDAELRHPEADFLYLARLSEETGGELVTPGDLGALANRIPNRRVRLLNEVTEPLWDTPLALLLVISLLTVEWVGRRVIRLI